MSFRYRQLKEASKAYKNGVKRKTTLSTGGVIGHGKRKDSFLNWKLVSLVTFLLVGGLVAKNFLGLSFKGFGKLVIDNPANPSLKGEPLVNTLIVKEENLGERLLITLESSEQFEYTLEVNGTEIKIGLPGVYVLSDITLQTYKIKITAADNFTSIGLLGKGEAIFEQAKWVTPSLLEISCRVPIKSISEDKIVKHPFSKEEEQTVMFNKVEELLENGHSEDALQILSDLVGMYPTNFLARGYLVTLLLQSNQLVKAEQILMKGLLQAPQDLDFLKLRVQLLLAKQDYKAAIIALERVVEIYPEATDCWALLGSVYYQHGYYEQAEAVYLKLLSWREDNVAWWIGLGLSLQGQGKQSQASEVYAATYEKFTDLPEDLLKFLQDRMR